MDVFAFAGTGTFSAHLTFDVTYTLADETYVEKGLEVYTVADDQGELKIVWRHQSVLDSRLKEKA